MVSATDCKEKVAMTVIVALRVTEQVPVPEQPPPLHPENVIRDRVCGEGDRSARGVVLEQLPPQVIPAARW
jgi:hypothetical protein